MAATASSTCSPTTPARLADLTGHVTREPTKNATTLLGSFPDTTMVDVLAEKR